MFTHLHNHTDHCLSRDTIIYNCLVHFKDGKVYRNNYTRIEKSRTIEYLFNNWKKHGSTFRYKVKVFDGEKFVQSLIKKIVCTGNKEVFELTTETGKRIKATSEHKFFTKDGWKRIKQLEVGCLMGCNGQPFYEDKEWLKQKYRIENLKQEEIAKLCGVKRKVISTRIVKFGLSKTRSEWCTGRKITDQLRNSLKFAMAKRREQLSKIKPKTANASRLRARKLGLNISKCQMCENIDKRIVIHHKDEDPFNNELDNLQPLCFSCHNKVHSSQPFTVKYEKLISIKRIGVEVTYDLEVEHEAHNFVANGFITHNSSLDGLGKIEKYVERCKELGFDALAITDHGNIDGVLKFYKECTENNIKPIIGGELYIVKDIDVRERKEERGHITLLCKNDIGWSNLKKLVTLSNLKGFYYKPRIDVEMLLAHSEGLIIMTACMGSFINFDWGINLLHQLNKNDVYIELMSHNFKEQREYNEFCLRMNREFGYKLVATNDCHYVNKDDAQGQEVLLAIQTKKKWNDPDRWKLDGEFWLKTRKEMVDSFAEQSVVPRETVFDAIENTSEVAEKCNLTLKEKEVSLPEVIKGEDETDYLWKLTLDNCLSRFQHLSDNIREVYHERMKFEFDLIKEKGFVRYFLMVWELVNWCKENDIMTGPGRGSASGSLVCYLLGITQVDPIKYDLVFSRFIDLERTDLPDIDIDFEDIKRHLVREHLEKLYGESHVAGISTFSIMKGRSALRDVSRVFDVPLADVNKVCTVIEQKIEGEEGDGETIKDAIENFEEGKEFNKKYKQVTNISMKMEGVMRQRGVHAAAIVVSDKDLTNGDSCALVLNREKEPTINWDKDDIEFVGLMKLDVLGLKMLSVLNFCRKLIKDNIVFNDIPLDDEKCYKEFTSGKTIGCFQVESPGLRKFCQQLGVDSFDMIMSATSLYRPGPLRSGMADLFVKRKRGEEEVRSISPIIDEITKDTLGIILYQEQMMRLVRELAGFDWIKVNKIRKLIAKSKGKGALKEYEDEFANGCVESNTLTDSQARDLWEDLTTFGAYSFNKAHACAYSIITYWGMWLKIHYPLEYICSLLTYGSDNKEKKNEYIMEAFRLGVEIRPPKIGISEADTWKIFDKVLYAPFMEIYGVGEKTAQKYTKLGKKGFYNKDGSPKKLLGLLEKVGAKENKPVTDDDADRISPFLTFSLVKNKLRKSKNIKALLERSTEISKLSDLDLINVDSTPKLYFGEITEVSLTVRRGKIDSYTTASASFKDGTGDCKFQFENKFYIDNKDKVEKCEGEIVLIQAASPKKAGSLIVKKVWFHDDLMNCDVRGLFLNAIEEKRFRNRDLLKCDDCKLVNECKSPMLPTPGHMNVMIVSDFPNIVDEQNEEVLSGDGGKILWQELIEKGYDKRSFQVTSIVKCHPSITKKPTKVQMKACSKWIKEEIEMVSPPLVLALGSATLKFFNDEDSGIMDKCGTTEWNEKYGFWVCWCINPNSVLYTESNKELFKQGIENFCNKLNILHSIF